MESSSPDEQKGADDGVKNNEEVKPKIENCSGRGLEVDQELDELLDCELYHVLFRFVAQSLYSTCVYTKACVDRLLIFDVVCIDHTV